MSVKTFDPKSCVILVGGVPISGFAEDSMIEVMRDGDSFTKKTGADGEVSRARNRDRAGSLKITLMQTSASNDYLAGLNVADELTNDGMVPVGGKDLNGRSLFFAAYAWIKKPADIKWGKNLEAREWIIDTGALDIFPGGN